MRARAKEHLPHVLLTLLSIIQALALELLWTRVTQADHLFHASLHSALFLGQMVITFLGIVVIWIVYATSVMRFRWVPGISDSVHPFLVGILQFMMIEAMGSWTVGWWFLLLGILFALMNWISHVVMYRARRDEDNREFFANVPPATLRDFIGPAAMVTIFLLFGIALILQPQWLLLALAGQVVSFSMLIWQMKSLTFFWNRTMGVASIDRESARWEPGAVYQVALV